MTNADDEIRHDRRGLTKREHFAAMAMQGLLSNGQFTQYDTSNVYLSEVTKRAILYADALIAELNKKK